MKIKFIPERETKNTIRFAEALEGAMDSPVIGTLYVQKHALKTINYKPEQAIVVTLEVTNQ